MRSAWNVRRMDIFTSVFATPGSADVRPARSRRSAACVVSSGCCLQQTGDDVRCAARPRSPSSSRASASSLTRDDQLRRRLTPPRVHPHVERTDALVAEAAIGIVELHRRHAEVRQNHVGVFETLGRERLRQAGEVGVARDEGVGAEAGRAQARFRAWQLERIDVEPDEPSARLHALQDRARVTAAAERAIDRHLARAWAAGSSTTSSTMIGRCMPAGVLPDARTFCISAGYRSGFSSLYLSWNSRGFLPGYRRRRLCVAGASGPVSGTGDCEMEPARQATAHSRTRVRRTARWR